MPKLRPETLAARRENILDAAERCFARSGFHRCTMAEICAEAGISAGALYVHFRSKEALIAGSAERDRLNLADQFAAVAKAPDIAAALTKVAEHYAAEEPLHKRVLGAEIGLEATRNPTVSEIHGSVESFVLESLEELIERARQEGRLAPDLDHRTIAELLCVIGEGLMWRRAIVPGFDARPLLPAITGIVEGLLKPVAPARSPKQSLKPAEIEEDR